MKLTQRVVASLQLPTGKTDVIHFDDEISGFGYRLRKGAGGKVLRSWVCQYRHGGSSRRLLLGAATVLGAEQARTMAKKALGRVANGEDPQASKLDRRGKDRHTLKATVADYSSKIGSSTSIAAVMQTRSWRSSSARCAHAPIPSWCAISAVRISNRCIASRLIRLPARTLRAG